MIRNKSFLLLFIVSVALLEWYWIFLYAVAFIGISFVLLVIVFFLLGSCYVSMETNEEQRFYHKLCIVAVLLLIVCMLLL